MICCRPGCVRTTPKWRTGKDGKPRSGWPRLQAHQELEREDEADELNRAAGAASQLPADEVVA